MIKENETMASAENGCKWKSYVKSAKPDSMGSELRGFSYTQNLNLKCVCVCVHVRACVLLSHKTKKEVLRGQVENKGKDNM